MNEVRYWDTYLTHIALSALLAWIVWVWRGLVRRDRIYSLNPPTISDRILNLLTLVAALAIVGGFGAITYMEIYIQSRP